ncbi:uncharacterized protein LOC111365259 [Olea europaea var. sylvestris]|uniref:uncharacterized protein LOC111365259 n=1 Tax=Olea europaea var. sylvestris TaxID=158386 RepID=UPI000C1D1F48|nr:uncharacterized protein LOC111365259 [Olea europaea var. sylvestris]
MPGKPHREEQPQKPMTAALSLPTQRPWPTNIISTTSATRQHPQRCLSLNVQSLRFDFQDNKSTQYIGGASALNSIKLQQNTSNKSRPKERKQQNQEPKEEQKRQLSGADVLWALKRATAQKSKKKKDKRVTLPRDEIFVRPKIEGSVDYSRVTSVRPLYIKSEWSDRLEELERQLQELIDT